MTPISTQHLKDTIGKAFVDIMYLLQNGSTTDDRLRVTHYYAEILDAIDKLKADGQEALCKLQTMLGEVKKKRGERNTVTLTLDEALKIEYALYVAIQTWGGRLANVDIDLFPDSLRLIQDKLPRSLKRG